MLKLGIKDSEVISVNLILVPSFVNFNKIIYLKCF